MNYSDPELIEGLASEYVIGTLKGPARQRFERLMSQHYWIRAVVWSWEEQLVPLAATVPEITPPARAWRAIRKQIFPAAKLSLFSTLAFWQGFSVVASAAAILLTVLVSIQPIPEPGEEYIAVFNDEQAQPLWLVSTDLNTGKIKVRAVNAQAAAVDKAYELWMLPADGNPQSLGLMPVSGSYVETSLSPGLLGILRNAQGLAISLEPEGGSPTGLPTGPVLYQAELVSL